MADVAEANEDNVNILSYESFFYAGMMIGCATAPVLLSRRGELPTTEGARCLPFFAEIIIHLVLNL
jgi:hypothetical protein